VKTPSYVWLLVFILLGEFMVGSGWGQTHQSTPQPPSTITRPDSIQDSGFYNYWANMTAQGRAGGVLLGKLALEGEPLPWEPMLVAVECNGATVNLTQTDLEGQFVIRFEDNHGIEKIPQDAQRQMETKYEGCIVRGTLAGFRSGEKTIKVSNFRDQPDLGTITLSPEGRGGGSEASLTTKAAPAPAMKAYEKARGDWLEQNNSGAQKNLQKAVQIYPEFAEAWLQLGRLRADGDRQGARDAFAKALASDPNFVLPYEQLAVLAAQEQKWQETLEHTGKALALDPAGTPLLWYYDALAKFQLGNIDGAQKSAQKSLDIDPRHSVANTEQLLAIALVRKGDYAAALAHLKNCLTYAPNQSAEDLIKQQIAQLEHSKKAVAK
jgi:tetratricopeptide (TPR) repeat protein